MKKLTFIFLVGFALSNPGAFAQTFTYTATSRQPVADTIFGRVVVDNYRWMEDMGSQQVKDWLKMQTDYTTDILDRIPGRDSLLKEYKEIDKSAPSFTIPPQRGGNRYFYARTLAGENIGKLYYREGAAGKEVLLFDPLTYKGGKDSITYFFYSPSPDGKKIILFLSKQGQQVNTTRFLNVDTKTFYPETIFPGSLFRDWSTTWTPDSKGIIYLAARTSDYLSNDFRKDARAFYHAVGTDAQKDILIVSREQNPELNIKPEDLILPSFSLDRKYFIVTLFSGWQNQNRKYVAPAADLFRSKINWKNFVRAEDKIQEAFIYNDQVYFLSRKDAPKGKVLRISLNKVDLSKAKAIIPEGERNIEGVALSRNYLFVTSTDGMKSFVDQYNLKTGEVKPVKIPMNGNAWVQTFNAKTDKCIFYVSSWTQPMTKYDYDPVTGESKLSSFDDGANYAIAKDLTVEEVEVPGHDGVMIPLSLVYKKGIRKDGKNIVYMTGYGSYGMSNTPWFMPNYVPLLTRNVILAVTHPRGGGEKGEEWHKAGFKTTKPNTWKDFISSAEYLVKHGYTSPQHIIGEGSSAGGILIGRAILERPDLFAASIHNVPVSNALRHEYRSIGGTDAKEFGTIKDSLEAMALLEMDAYLNVKQGVRYPAVLAIAGMNDVTVPAWQPGKFVAALQNAAASERPALLLVAYNCGHWCDQKDAQQRLDANKLAFALWQAGHKDFQPVKD